MRTNTWQALIVLLIVLGFVTLGAWIATVGSPLVLGLFRYGTPVAALGVIALMVHVWRRPDALPDHLRQLAGRYFEQDGFCFAPTVETAADGTSWFSVYFQNRFERAADARVLVRPGVRSFRVSRHPLPTVVLDVRCPGVAFGVVRVPFPVPARYHGRKVNFEVAADAKYPGGRGKLHRVRGGVRVGSTSELSGRHQLLSFVAMLFLGIISSHQAASVTLQLPTNIDDAEGDAGAPWGPEILWQPDLPPGDFSDVPRRAA